MAEYSFINFNYADPKDKESGNMHDVTDYTLKDPDGKKPQTAKLPKLSDDKFYEVTIKPENIESGKID